MRPRVALPSSHEAQQPDRQLEGGNHERDDHQRHRHLQVRLRPTSHVRRYPRRRRATRTRCSGGRDIGRTRVAPDSEPDPQAHHPTRRVVVIAESQTGAIAPGPRTVGGRPGCQADATSCGDAFPVQLAKRPPRVTDNWLEGGGRPPARSLSRVRARACERKWWAFASPETRPRVDPNAEGEGPGPAGLDQRPLGGGGRHRGYECAGDRISRASRLRRCLALRGAAVLVQRRALDAAADPQKDVAGGAAGEEDGVRRDHRAPLLPRAGAALKLSVGLASHALTVTPEAVVSEARATPRRRRRSRCSIRRASRSRISRSHAPPSRTPPASTSCRSSSRARAARATPPARSVANPHTPLSGCPLPPRRRHRGPPRPTRRGS